MATDSDVVALALVTAEALEEQGEIRQAARWLRLAADQAMSEGQHDRGLVLARTAAALTRALRPSPSAPSFTRSTLPRGPSPRAAVARTTNARTTATRISHVAVPRSHSRPAMMRLASARAENATRPDTSSAEDAAGERRWEKALTSLASSMEGMLALLGGAG